MASHLEAHQYREDAAGEPSLPPMCPGNRCHSGSPCHCGPRASLFLQAVRTRGEELTEDWWSPFKPSMDEGRMRCRERMLGPGPEVRVQAQPSHHATGHLCSRPQLHLHKTRVGWIGGQQGHYHPESSLPTSHVSGKKTWNPCSLSA